MDHKNDGVVQELAIIKKMLIENDHTNARDRLLNLHLRFPNLDKISEMITVCEILSSADLEFSDYGTDWYWVLQAPPSASKSDIQRAYLKLTTLLKPLKNDFPGTASALKLIQDAFFSLSNADRLSIFDSKRAVHLGNTKPINFEENVNVLDELVAEVENVEEEMELEHGQENHTFAVGQVWAAFDEENMPRRYARISAIKKLPLPFGLYMSWLKPAPDNADERRWCEVGLPVVCGFFELEEDEMMVTELKMFSHVIFQLASPVPYRVEIRPKQNEVWAIYEDWSLSKWCSFPEEREGSVIQMVEILMNYSSEVDAKVVVLVEVEGYTNVFKRCRNSDTFTIPSTHLFKFSHNVPALRFTGDEDETWFKLDPMAIPDITGCNEDNNTHQIRNH